VSRTLVHAPEKVQELRHGDERHCHENGVCNLESDESLFPIDCTYVIPYKVRWTLRRSKPPRSYILTTSLNPDRQRSRMQLKKVLKRTQGNEDWLDDDVEPAPYLHKHCCQYYWAMW
jgi:hypothetical protein